MGGFWAALLKVHEVRACTAIRMYPDIHLYVFTLSYFISELFDTFSVYHVSCRAWVIQYKR